MEDTTSENIKESNGGYGATNQRMTIFIFQMWDYWWNGTDLIIDFKIRHAKQKLPSWGLQSRMSVVIICSCLIAVSNIKKEMQSCFFKDKVMVLTQSQFLPCAYYCIQKGMYRGLLWIRAECKRKAVVTRVYLLTHVYL